MKGTRINLKNPDGIRSLLDQEKNPNSKIKLVFLNLVTGSLLDFEKICELCGIPISTGYEWIRNWNEKGYGSIMEKEGRGGRPPKLSAYDLLKLDKYLKKKESWQIKEVKTLIKRKFGVDLSEDQINRILKQKLKKDFPKKSNVIQTESDERYMDIFDLAGEAILKIDPEERITYWNRSAEKQFGWNSQETMGKKLNALTLDSNEERNKIMQDILSGNDIPGIVNTFLHRNKNRIDVCLNFFSIKNSNNGIAGALCIIRDISERNRNMEYLRKANEKLEDCNLEIAVETKKVNKLMSDVMKLKTVIDAAPDAMVVVDAFCRVQLRNSAADKLYARPFPYDEKFENNEHLQFFYPQGIPYNSRDLPLTRSALDGEAQTNVEMNILTDGQKRNLMVTSMPLRDNKGKLIGAVGVFQDISEGKKIDELRYENERLVTASKARSEFLTIMSHELRTPLTSIIGYSILLKEKNPGKLNKKQELIIDNILSSSKHLLDLINGILDLAKIESGKLEMLIEEISLPDTVDETFKLFEEKAEKKNIILKKEIDPEFPPLSVDRQKFKQILFNLTGNALKFSKEGGGTITVSAEKEEDNAKISVSDTGIGIREEDIHKLFQRFEQLDSGITRKYDGTGLGLAITKQLVELHGGKIWVESRYGEGSNFIFLIPISGKRII